MPATGLLVTQRQSYPGRKDAAACIAKQSSKIGDEFIIEGNDFSVKCEHGKSVTYVSSKQLSLQ
jgi:hypothetical protein